MNKQVLTVGLPIDVERQFSEGLSIVKLSQLACEDVEEAQHLITAISFWKRCYKRADHKCGVEGWEYWRSQYCRHDRCIEEQITRWICQAQICWDNSRGRVKYVKLDTRKVPEEVCNDIKVAFRAGNIFIRTDSEEDVRTARKQFGFWRRKKYMDENSPKPWNGELFCYNIPATWCHVFSCNSSKTMPFLQFSSSPIYSPMH